MQNRNAPVNSSLPDKGDHGLYHKNEATPFEMGWLRFGLSAYSFFTARTPPPAV